MVEGAFSRRQRTEGALPSSFDRLRMRASGVSVALMVSLSNHEGAWRCIGTAL
jgi:hypothetical protein